VGFICAALLFLTLKRLVRNPALYQEPAAGAPPLWIRGILIATCTGVSFAHGSDDGQKGMGLIMLILGRTLPPAYALNRALPDSDLQEFRRASVSAAALAGEKAAGTAAPADARAALSHYVAHRKRDDATYAALGALIGDIAAQVNAWGSLRR